MNKKRVIASILCVIMVVSLLTSILGGCMPATKSNEEDTHIHETEVSETEAPASEETEALVENENGIETIKFDELFEFVKTSIEDGNHDIRAILGSEDFAAFIPFACMLEEIPEDYMPSLRNPVEGVIDGAVLMPVIGSQPFIAYLFETADASALVGALKAEADPRWNICVEASTTVCEAIGENYVFFAMIP